MTTFTPVIREWENDFRELAAWIGLWFRYRKHAFKMSLAIRMADIKQQAFNRRYHVMLVQLPEGDRLAAVSRREIAALKRKKWLPRHLSKEMLDKSVFYSTPLERNNRATASERSAAKRKYMTFVRQRVR
jgi:hypothetical protein